MRRLSVGKPDLAAEFAAMQDPPADHVRPAQQVLRPAQVAGSERCAHRRTRDALLALDDRRHLLELESTPARMPLQQRDVPGAARAKAEVVADKQPAGIAAGDQQIDESLCRQRRERTVEMLDDRAIEALLGQRTQLVAQR